MVLPPESAAIPALGCGVVSAEASGADAFEVPNGDNTRSNIAAPLQGRAISHHAIKCVANHE